MLRFLVFISLLLGMALQAQSQAVLINANKKPLNLLLQDISNDHDIHISFDDEMLSGFLVSVNQEFSNPEEAIQNIVKPFPLTVEKVGGVLVIFENETSEKSIQIKNYRISGQILETETREPLPYSHVTINGHAMATDITGNFSFISEGDSIFNLKASQLGYFILDTTLVGDGDHKLLLIPSVIGLKEVVITDQVIEKATQIGQQAGVEKLNHKTANFLPGFGDNSVYNLMRLQPGILASGEQSGEPVIWGGYAGQSKVTFDGFTLYGLKNFNDNISVFNPLITKDINIFKGGYDVRYGERVSGIVEVTGRNGNMQKPSFEISINNMTLNGVVETPLKKNRSSLLLSFRQTYFDLYNPLDVELRRNQNQNNNSRDVTVEPDYSFRDLNLRYSHISKGGDLFYISLYGSGDDFAYDVNEPLQYVSFIKKTGERIDQYGGAVFYGKRWRNGNSSNFKLAGTQMKSEFDNLQLFKNEQFQYENITQNFTSTNKVDEYNLDVENVFTVTKNQTFEFGGGFYHNKIELVEDTFNVNLVDIQNKATRGYLFFQDVISNDQGSNIKIGMRMSYADNMQKFFPEPRISTSVQIAENWKFNAAWGIYNQFLVNTSVVDENGNYRYIRALANGEDVPVISSSHYVLGTSYSNNNFLFSLEGFYKTTSGISRYVNSQKLNIEDVFEGDSKSYGLDLMMQAEFDHLQAWIAYTLAKVEEKYEYQIKQEYRPALHDQRHELKLASLFNFDPWYFSASYVYGSGFPLGTLSISGYEEPQSYSRLDVSFTYRFKLTKPQIETGISILNVLNTQNLKYENFERVPAIQNASINIYSEAIPFTPALYLKIALN